MPESAEKPQQLFHFPKQFSLSCWLASLLLWSHWKQLKSYRGEKEVWVFLGFVCLFSRCSYATVLMQSSHLCAEIWKRNGAFCIIAGAPVSTKMLWIAIHLEISSLSWTAAVAKDTAFQNSSSAFTGELKVLSCFSAKLILFPPRPNSHGCWGGGWAAVTHTGPSWPHGLSRCPLWCSSTHTVNQLDFLNHQETFPVSGVCFQLENKPRWLTVENNKRVSRRGWHERVASRGEEPDNPLGSSNFLATGLNPLNCIV